MKDKLAEDLVSIDKEILEDREEEITGKILIFPTHYKITNYSHFRSTKFEEYLSVWNKIYFKYTYGAYILDELEDTLIVPGGIHLIDIESYFPDLEIEDYKFEHAQIRRHNRPIKVKYKARDEIQRKAIEFLMDKKYGFDNTQKLLTLNTGDGKTFCSVKHISMSKRIPMIFVNKKNLIEQWVERIKEYTDTTDEEIYIISGKASITKLLKMDEKDLVKYKFYIAMHRTISNYIKEDKYDLLKDLFTHLSISLKVFDEAHLEYENIATVDMITYCPSLYLTATPSRSNYLEDRVYRILIGNIPKFSSTNKKIKNKGENYHRVIIGKYNTNPSDEFLAKFKKASSKRGFNVPTYINYIIEDKFNDFYKPLKTILTNLVYPKKKGTKRCIILIKQIDLIDKLYNQLTEDLSEINPNLKLGRYHSEMSLKEKERVLAEDDLIITTESSVGTGMDIENLEAMISTIPTSSAVVTAQMLGRLRYLDENREVIYYDLVDMGFEECRSQLSRRKNKVYRKKAKRIQEFNL